MLTCDDQFKVGFCLDSMCEDPADENSSNSEMHTRKLWTL